MKYFYLVAIMAFFISCESPDFTGTFENQDSIFVIEDNLEIKHTPKLEGKVKHNSTIKGKLLNLSGNTYQLKLFAGKEEMIDTCKITRTGSGIEIVFNDGKEYAYNKKGY